MKNKKNNDSGAILLYMGLLAIMAACPPIGVALVFCFVLSDGIAPGFLGCFIPIIFFSILAAINAVFS